VKPHGQTLIEITRGRVERTVERSPVAVKDIPGFFGDSRIDVDGLEAPLRREA
jgi:hypothetical protein